MPEPTGSFDPGLVELIVAIIGLLGLVGVAVVNRLGTKRSKLNEQVNQFIDNLQEDNASLRLEIRELRAELRNCEAQRREDFMGAVEKLFPETGPKGLDP